MGVGVVLKLHVEILQTVRHRVTDLEGKEDKDQARQTISDQSFVSNAWLFSCYQNYFVSNAFPFFSVRKQAAISRERCFHHHNIW